MMDDDLNSVIARMGTDDETNLSSEIEAEHRFMLDTERELREYLSYLRYTR